MIGDPGITIIPNAGITIGTSNGAVNRTRSNGGNKSYDFTSFTFTNAGRIGNTGPTLENLLSSYDTAAYPWLTDTAFFNSTNGIQLWTVPETATYRITARGAQGSAPGETTGGRGAIMQGDFALTAGDKIQILVGQTAPVNIPARVDKSSSGGGGTFVVYENGTTVDRILIIAGGGGGTGSTRPLSADASIGTAGCQGRSGGAGGVNGNGGTNTSANGAGGGFLTSGTGSTPSNGEGKSFILGGAGGAVNASYAATGGGFGGGGSPQNGLLFRYGGGGGYSGGGASSTFGNTDGTGDTTGHWGGGGGSYNAGTGQVNSVGNTNSGSVVIQKL